MQIVEGQHDTLQDVQTVEIAYLPGLSAKCKRCTLNYDEELESCPHCSGLSDEDVEELKMKIAADKASAKPIAYLFVFLALLVTSALAAFTMFGAK